MAKNKQTSSDSSVKARNKKAFHEYHILETFMAGMVLQGTEIKSIRAGKISIVESYAKIERGELWLLKSNIAHYEQGNRYNHQPDRTRKLLLTKAEIRKIDQRLKQESLTLVPLKVFLRGGWAKIELGLAKGKKLHDKRETLANKSIKREMDRAAKGNY